VEPGTAVVVQGLPGPADYVVSVASAKDGTAPVGAVTTIDVIGSAYLYNITLREAIETARQAEREGYDAYVIGSWTDPFLREMRSAVDIPVVSTVEASLLLARSLGRMQGLHNHVVEVTGETTATGTGLLIAFYGVGEQSFYVAGKYTEDYERVAGRWLFKRWSSGCTSPSRSRPAGLATGAITSSTPARTSPTTPICGPTRRSDRTGAPSSSPGPAPG
jgi:hypothetical protein